MNREALDATEGLSDPAEQSSLRDLAERARSSGNGVMRGIDRHGCYWEEANGDRTYLAPTILALLATLDQLRAERIDVERLRTAIYNTAVGPDDCKTWGRIADIAAEYDRLASQTREEGT